MLTVVVLPKTVKLPVTLKSSPTVTKPSAAIVIAAAVVALPI